HHGHDASSILHPEVGARAPHGCRLEDREGRDPGLRRTDAASYLRPPRHPPRDVTKPLRVVVSFTVSPRQAGGVSVSVVIANYNGAHLLADCLESLAGQDQNAIEILVVDNASIDDSATQAARYDCRFIPLDSNRGLGAAYNSGARVARGDYLFFVNNDMRF